MKILAIIPALIVAAAIALASAPAAQAASASTAVEAENVKANIQLQNDKVAPGSEVPVNVQISIGPGWHIYGNSVSQDFVPTSVAFSSPIVAKQKIDYPAPTPVTFKGLGETLPVYQQSVTAKGSILIDPKAKPGDYRIPGTFKFQECNDNICKMPQAVKFEIPVSVATK